MRRRISIRGCVRPSVRRSVPSYFRCRKSVSVKATGKSCVVCEKATGRSGIVCERMTGKSGVVCEKAFTIESSSFCLQVFLLDLNPLRKREGFTPLPFSASPPSTVGQNNQKPKWKYWATRSSVRSFARTAYSFACSGLLASLAHFAHSLARGKVID